MISIDDHPPPDPSSSDYQNHHQQKQVSHELKKINNGEKAPASVSVIDLLKKPTDAILLDDTKNPLPNFSIRDYVFGSRSKDIASNWPFSQENLQLCLQNGVKNLLPPFQSLDLLISNTSGNRCAIENRLPDEEIVSISDGKLTGSVEKDLGHRKSKKSHPAASSQKTLNTTNLTTVKKYKFVMKLNSGVERVDQEITPNNFIVSETMLASKVCPVCKTFSSSSNTTLNAHIDRCLSEESSMKWTTNPKKIIAKHRIKPRKTRLMVDIYKTAPCCTVEELDKRNGTSWATNSNFPDQELEFQAQEKKQESTFVPEVTDHDGTVYIDTNGTKVRILSMPKVGTLDDHEARKLQKGGKGSKIIAEKKKKKAYRQKNRDKSFKLIANSKKFCSLKPHHPVSEAIGGQEEDVVIEESRDKEDEMGEKLMEARDHKQMADLAITRPPWACSKRTHLTKKRRSRMLTKPKEGSLLQDSYEDPLGITSNGGKFSSLQDNPSSANPERNAGSKINLKRKFSALKKSRVDSLSKENADTGPSQDSWKQKSLTEEDDTSENLSFEIVNVVEAKKKKSVTSKSTSNGYSSEGLEIDHVKSARTDEIPSHSDHLHGRSFMGLRNSLDDEFSKMVSRLDNKFDIDNIMIRNKGEDFTDDNEKEGNLYFHEIDPIPIPGPPGSFLPPSPGGDDMVSEEVQGNSSLTTTSRFHSSTEEQYHHHHHHHDMMLDSPISTISSSSLAISDDHKLSVGLATNLSFTNVVIDVVDQKSSDLNASNNLRSVDAIFTEKGPTPFGLKNDQHPCVCSRKESVFSKNLPSYLQESESFSLIINHPKLPPPETVKPPWVKLPFYRDFDQSVVSPSTPVLRLMGKNLTVVKTDDDDRYGVSSYGYPCDDQKPVIFNHNQNGSNFRHFNVHPPKKTSNVIDNEGSKEIIVIDDGMIDQERMTRRNNHGHGHHLPSNSGGFPYYHITDEF